MPFFSLYFVFFSDLTLDVGCLFIFHSVFFLFLCRGFFFGIVFVNWFVFGLSLYLFAFLLSMYLNLYFSPSPALYARYAYYLFSFYPNRTCNTSWHHSLFISFFHFPSFSFISSDNPVLSLCYVWNLCIEFISNVIYSEGLTIDDNLDIILNCYCISRISGMRIIVILNGYVLSAKSGFPKCKREKNESNLNLRYDNDTRSRKENWQCTHKLRPPILVESFSPVLNMY